MLKVADALSDAGYPVTMISARFTDWAWDADQELRRTRSWKWIVIDHTPKGSPATYFVSGMEYRASRLAAKYLGAERCPIALAARAYGRIHGPLVKAAIAQRADFYYGGTAGTIAATAEAAHAVGSRYALDLEDFHSGEHPAGAEGMLDNSLARRVEGAILRNAQFLTTAGSSMAEAYHEAYGIRPLAINNVCPLPSTEPSTLPASPDGLSLYWFGQTIGLDKQIQVAVRAVGIAGIRAELHLRGRAAPGCWESLRDLAADVAPKLNLTLSDPGPPNRMVELCGGHDIGLAMFPDVQALNWNAVMGNKSLTYLAAGLALAITDTPGHKPLIENLGADCIPFPSGDVDRLAEGLARIAADPEALVRAKKASWRAAVRRWHWEHPEERGALLEAVAHAVR
jgi:hypothetical protein